MEAIKNLLLQTGLVVDNEYLDKYVNLIYANLSTIKKGGLTQKHHIIPKDFYKKLNKAVDNSSSNTVNLIYSDHVMAHAYLSKCCIDKDLSYKTSIILRFIKNKLNEINITESDKLIYDDVYKQYVESSKEKRRLKHLQYIEKKKIALNNWLNECHRCERCNAIMTSYYGTGRFCSEKCAKSHQHSEETKLHLQQLSKLGLCGNKGKHFSEEHKAKISASNKGKTRTFEQRKHISDAHLGKKGIYTWRKVDGKRIYTKK